MRNLFVLLLTGAVALGLAASTSVAQKTDEKKPDPDKVLADLLKAVKQTENVDAQINAIVGLADFGPKAEPALADLLDALKSKNEDLRLNAAITLAKIGPAAIKPVAKLLNSKDNDTKFYAIWTIGWIGPEAKSTVPAMIKLAGDKNEGIRRKAIFALGRLAGDPSKTIDVLVKAFNDESDEVRQAAGDALSKFGKSAVPHLIGLLKSENLKVRQQATTSLGDIGADAAQAVPLLKDLFLSEKNVNPYHEAQILAKIGGKAGVAALEAGFKGTNPNVRQAASQSLQQVGADAVPILVDALGDKNVEVRRLAAQTLWPMRIGDKSVVIALAFALSDEDDQVRQSSMSALQQLGIQAKLAAPKLKAALVDMNPNVRVQAYYLLQQFGEDLKPTMLKALDSKDNKVRINTAALMVQVGYEINAATPILVEALKSDDSALKTQAAFTLAQRQLEKEKVLPIFLDSIKHKTASVRLQGVQGLSMFGQTAAAHAPEIAKLLADPDGQVRQQSIYALQNVGGAQGEKVVPILQGVFKDGNADARRTVLQVAWVYGAKSKELITSGLRDKDAGVRQQAIWALQNMQGDLSEALPTIVSLMKDKDAGVNRTQLVWLLQRAGDGAIPHLGDLLKDSDENVRQQVSFVLRNMGGKKVAKAMPAIKEAINDKNPNIRHNCMFLIAQGEEGGPEFIAKLLTDSKDGGVRSAALQTLVSTNNKKVVLPLLKDLMKDESTSVRQMCVNILGNFGQDSKEGFEVFSMGLKDSESQVRIQAAYMGSYFGKQAIEPLADSLKTHKDSAYRQAALQSLVNMQAAPKSGVAALTDCLKDSNVTVKIWACVTLGNIGSDAKSALPALKELTNDPNAQVQQQARAAMQRIGAKDKDKDK